MFTVFPASASRGLSGARMHTMINPKHAVRADGFTLIELMIVVVIVSILVGIAVPSYQNQTRESRRTDAKTAILDMAGREERYFNTSNIYTSIPSNLGYGTSYDAASTTTASAAIPIGRGYYTLSVTTVTPTATVAPSYTITATAVGTQASDTACGNFTLTNTGLQGVTGTATPASCWGN